MPAGRCSTTVPDWTFTDSELNEFVEWLFDGIPGALDTFLYDHPEGLVDRSDRRQLQSLAKRLRGQMRARLHNLRQNRGLTGYVSEDGRHWFERRRHLARCGRCLLPSGAEVHRRCFRCGSPFHGQRTCPAAEESA